MERQVKFGLTKTNIKKIHSIKKKLKKLKFPRLRDFLSFQVETLPVPIAAIVSKSTVAYCFEHHDYEKGRLVYSVFSLLVQFILPLSLITLAHR